MSTGNFAWFGFLPFLFKYRIKNVQCLSTLSFCGKYISELLHLAFPDGGQEREKERDLFTPFKI